MRTYIEKESKELAREIADFIINETKQNRAVNLDELIEHMRKNYGVPERITEQVLVIALASLPHYMVTFNESI